MEIVRQHVLNQCFWKYLANRRRPISPETQALFDMGNQGEAEVKKRLDPKFKDQEILYHVVVHDEEVRGVIRGTPDFLIRGMIGYEVKITRQTNMVKLPYDNHLRQATFYAEISHTPFLLKYYNDKLQMLKDVFVYPDIIGVTELFESRALKWWIYEECRRNEVDSSDMELCNPIDQQECYWCDYKREKRCPKWA